MRFIEREPVRFVLAGGLNAIATYIAYLALLPLVGYTVAYSVQFVGGIFFAYYLNARLVFRRPLKWQHALQYPLVYVLQYGLGITLMTALIEDLHFRAELAPILVVVTTLPLTFWLSRWIIKRESRGSTAKPAIPKEAEAPDIGSDAKLPSRGHTSFSSPRGPRSCC